MSTFSDESQLFATIGAFIWGELKTLTVLPVIPGESTNSHRKAIAI
jgi:hypothetical protein